MSRMPSTSTGTSSVTPRRARRGLDLDAQRVARRREHEPAARERVERHRPGGRRRSPAARARRAPRRAGARPTRRSSRTGSVTTACASSPVEHLGEQRSDAPSFTRSSTPGRPARGGRRRAAGTSHRLAVPTMPKLALPTWSPCSAATSSWSSSSSRRIRRARASTTWPDSVGVAPRPAPGEQRDAELGLELADLLGDVRLHRAQRVGGRGERALLVDGDQRLEMAQLHDVPPSPPGRISSPSSVTHR